MKIDENSLIDKIYPKFKNIDFAKFKILFSNFIKTEPSTKLAVNDFGKFREDDLAKDFKTYLAKKQADYQKQASDNYQKSRLNEIDPADVDTSNLDLNKELNPKFWVDEQLKPNIRVALLEISKKYIEYLELEDVEIHDIVFTGSLANTNYTDESDVDIHIIIDYDDIDKNKDLLLDYFIAKKDLWSDKYNITIMGYPVELFVQDDDQPRDWTAVYSLIKGDWIQKPDLKAKSEIDKRTIRDKVIGIVNKIEKLEKEAESGEDHEQTLKKIDELKEYITNLRKKGLPEGGEMSNENLIFKVLRTGKFLDRLDDIKTKLITKDYSLKEAK